MSALESAVRALHRDLSRLHVGHALVRGLAVAAYGGPGATHDVDFAVAVADDRAAEGLIYDLRRLGWEPAEHIEHEATGRLSGVRLVRSDLPRKCAWICSSPLSGSKMKSSGKPGVAHCSAGSRFRSLPVIT